MLTRCTMALNGVGLHTLDERIITQTIMESRVAEDWGFASTAKRIGQINTTHERQYIDITVAFSIRDIRNYEERADILDKVKAWAANGGELTVNYKPGKHLTVICYSNIETGFVRDWLTNYQMVFRAFETPYWVGDSAGVYKGNISANLTKTETVEIPGNAETVADIVLTASGNVSTVTVATGNSSITLDGLGMKSGNVLEMGQGVGGMYQITLDGSPIHEKRTPSSSDEIILLPGENTINITANGRLSAEITARGRWL